MAFLSPPARHAAQVVLRKSVDDVDCYRQLLAEHPEAARLGDRATVILECFPAARPVHVQAALGVSSGSALSAVDTARRRLKLQPPGARTRRVYQQAVMSWLCVECGEHFVPGQHARPYCSPRCKSTAKYVRYHRSVLARYGDDVPDDVLEAVATKRAFALGDLGYDEVARHLRPERRAEVIARDRGRCVLCQEHGAEIDHIDGPSPELSNLRYLCKPCHHAETRSHMSQIDTLEQFERAAELTRRVRAPTPLNLQDHIDWQQHWRAWVREHAEHADAVSVVETTAISCEKAIWLSRSAVSQRTITTLIDDIDGSDAEETVIFALDGVTYEIELSPVHADDLRGVLVPFLAAARSSGGSNRARRALSSRH